MKVTPGKKRQTVLILTYSGVRLRDCVSLFNRFEITSAQIGQLSIACHEYFKVKFIVVAKLCKSYCLDIGSHCPCSLSSSA